MGLIRDYLEEYLEKYSKIDYISKREIFEIIEYFIFNLLNK